MHSLQFDELSIRGIFSIWIFFLLCGTGYDLYKLFRAKAESRFSTKPQKPGLLSKVLMGFSLRRAALKLTSVPNWGDYSNDLGFVHGMRVFSATWVIQGHHYVLRDIHHSSDMLLFLRRIQSFLFSMQINAFMAVGSFFIITLIPSMLAILGVVYLFPLLMSGPYLKDNKVLETAPCDANWWRILTMTQNQVHSQRDICMPHYWYVSVDFQLAIFSSIILIMIMPRWPKLGLGVMGAIVVATSIATAAVTYAHNFLPLPLILTSRLKAILDTNLDVYMKTYPQAPSVFTGIIFGYLAAQPRKLPRKVQAICWTLAALFACSALFGVHTWHRGRAPERLESAFYAGFHRLSWAVGVSWVMYACATGRGGPVNKLLSWPLFYPLSRLSLAVYIVHVLLFTANAIVSRERKSYMPFLCVECPVAALDNLMFGGVKAKQDGDKDVAKQNEIQELKSVHATNGVLGHIGSSALSNGHSNGHSVGHSNGHSNGYVKYEDPIYDPPERDNTVANRKADEGRSALDSAHQRDAGESDSAVTVKF
ncbi:nose resistant to fluoxetine protein 6 [Ixodes scapularis]|uniref:nose resistant to fluoxetine protein 6 n=1 Tax=Ixodes scapularis TaxID=6945 RepID=UPI001C388F40|nr:nose resistant to fluoxetine protein 6 [Ixodes scapularis]